MKPLTETPQENPRLAARRPAVIPLETARPLTMRENAGIGLRDFFRRTRVCLGIIPVIAVLAIAPSASRSHASHAAGQAAPIRYKVEASESRFIVRAFAGGLLSAFSHDHTIAIRDFAGSASVTPSSLTPASLQLTIKADSLALTDKVSEKDRNEIQTTMKNSVLETGKHPDIIFKSTEISAEKTGEGRYRVRIAGDLTLHGVTRQVSINAAVEFSAGELRAKGEFPIKQTDYKITPVSAAAGTVKVKDELKLSFDIVAKQQ